MKCVQDQLKILENIQSKILDFVEKEDNMEENYSNFCEIINQQQNILKDSLNFKLLLQLIANIANNHCRSEYFFSKIEQILKKLKAEILKFFSSSEIFKVFRKNKRLILFLINEKILLFDSKILKLMEIENSDEKRYLEYFSPEVKKIIDEDNKFSYLLNQILIELPENFDEKRLKGENDDYLCELIRNDSIDQFITYVNKNDYPLNTIIIPSIYETNPFLMKKDVSLIKYAAFFGSVQIFKYLLFNKAFLEKSLSSYTVHSDNPEIINFFDENNDLNKISITKIGILESIKCHHNDAASYLERIYNDKISQDDYNDDEEYEDEDDEDDEDDDEEEDEEDDDENKSKPDKDIISYCFHYYNFLYLPENYIYLCDTCQYFCSYGYLPFVKITLSSSKIRNWLISLKNNLICATAKKDYHEVVDLLLLHLQITCLPSFNFCKRLTQLTIPSSIIYYVNCTKCFRRMRIIGNTYSSIV